ncbi:AAA family ATPase [Candidatus Babeliales bacterium]|nr:AAA family ATPase [Candidatus Babeliales bacterium]
MKNKLLLSLAMMIGFAPIQATIIKDVLETGKQIVIASYKTAQDAADFVVENSWKAPIGSQHNGGKIVVTSAALILAADQAAKLYTLSKYKKQPIIDEQTDKVIGWEYVDENNKRMYSDEIYQTIPQKFMKLWYKYPFIRNVTLGLISMALYSTMDNHLHGKTLNPDQFKIATPDESFPTFKDIIGAEDAKKKLTQFTQFLKKRNSCLTLGAQPVKGCITYGIPGTGKTEFARATAKETGLPLIHMNGSINTMWRGSGTAQLQKLQTFAQKHAPCIVYIDEIDNLAGKSNNSGWDTDTNATTNTFKSMLDGFEKQDPTKPIFFMGSTNNLSKIDPAIIRNGRMPSVEVAPPNQQEFKDMIHHKLFNSGKFKADPSIDISNIKSIFKPNQTTGADATALLNNAAMIAALQNKPMIDQSSYDQAIKDATPSAKQFSLKSTIFG